MRGDIDLTQFTGPHRLVLLQHAAYCGVILLVHVQWYRLRRDGFFLRFAKGLFPVLRQGGIDHLFRFDV